MRLETIERGLRNLGEEDLQTLAQRFAAAMAKASRPSIRKLELFITEDCNLRCDYCWVPKNPRCMTLDIAERAIDFVLGDLGPADSVEVTLFGGEPLLEFELVQRVMSYGAERARAIGKRVGWALTTNGTLLTPEMVEFAHRHGLNYLLSIDGIREAHDQHRRFSDGRGSFDEIAKRLPMLRNIQGWVGTRMTVTPTNVRYLRDSVSALVGLGINQFLIGDDVGSRWTRDGIALLQQQWIEVAEIYHNTRSAGYPIRITAFEDKPGRENRDLTHMWGCEAGRDKIAVMPSGDIYPCARFVDKAGIQDEFWLGHVDVGIVAERTRRELTDDRDVIRYRCMRCSERRRCTGSCPATNYLCTGSPFVAPRFDCTMRKFWGRLRRERPEFWEVSKIPLEVRAPGFDEECIPGKHRPLTYCRPLN